MKPVAFFQAHAPKGLNPLLNGGEHIAARGGAWSVDWR